jgi:hypothetical protein
MFTKDERWQTTEPNALQCKHCVYVLKHKTIDKSGYNMCKKYDRKPNGVLFNKAICPSFEVEES